MGISKAQEAGILALSLASLRGALFSKFPSCASVGFHYGQIQAARKRSRRNKTMKRKKARHIR